MPDRSSHDPYSPEASHPRSASGKAKKTTRPRKRAVKKTTAAAKPTPTSVPSKEALVPETTTTSKDGD